MGNRKVVSQARRQIVFARDAYRCMYCLTEAAQIGVDHFGPYRRLCVIPMDSEGRPYEIDHVVPYSKTADNSLNNLVTACWQCNNDKSNRVWKLAKNFPQMKITESL